MLPYEAVPVPLAPAVPTPVNDPLAPDIETASEEYRKRFAGPVGELFLSVQNRAAAALLDRTGPAAMRVLDIGGGHAQLTRLLLARGHSVAVQGSSAACFDRLHELRRLNGERLDYRLAPLTSIPAADGEFDLVCSFRLLAHVSSWQALIAEKCRLARRFVICEFPVAEGVQRLAQSLLPLKLRLEPDTRPFTPLPLDGVSAELGRHGFRIVATERQFVLPMALHRRLGSSTFTSISEGLLRHVGLTQQLGSPVMILAERVT